MAARLSIRARLTIAFVGALAIVLALAGTFVYVRTESQLTEAIDDRLEGRFEAIAAPLEAGEVPRDGDAAMVGGPSEEEFAQLIGPGGEVIASSTGELDAAAVEPGAVGSGAPQMIDGVTVPGVEGSARTLAGSVAGTVVVVGVSTEDRDEALGEIATGFAIGAPLALLVAGLLGYLLAARAMAPVESLRERAEAITLDRAGERLPLPPADDELRRLATTLNAMLDRIESALERERVFVADASHELRTPLAILRAELELADRPERDPAALRAALRSTAEEVERLSRLADDLLVIARTDQGRLPIEPEPVDVRELLERVAARFAAPAAAAGRSIAVEASEPIVADLDPTRIEQALGNLVDNALRHGAGEVRLLADASDGAVGLEVADGGDGFPPGFEGRAFERFTRADEGRTGAGAGLGLAIVSAIARAHGGSVEVVGDRAPAAVRITLPLIPLSSARHTPPAEPDERSRA